VESGYYRVGNLIQIPENKSVNHSELVSKEVADKTAFMRKGKIDSYKEEMPEEYIKKFDDWLEKAFENKEHRLHL
jgi:hypothetical protein